MRVKYLPVGSNEDEVFVSWIIWGRVIFDVAYTMVWFFSGDLYKVWLDVSCWITEHIQIIINSAQKVSRIKELYNGYFLDLGQVGLT